MWYYLLALPVSQEGASLNFRRIAEENVINPFKIHKCQRSISQYFTFSVERFFSLQNPPITISKNDLSVNFGKV